MLNMKKAKQARDKHRANYADFWLLTIILRVITAISCIVIIMLLGHFENGGLPTIGKIILTVALILGVIVNVALLDNLFWLRRHERNAYILTVRLIQGYEA